MTSFTPWSSMLGGLLIGFAAVLLWGLNGRIAGISGILGSCYSKPNSDFSWRLCFLTGLLLGAGLSAWIVSVPDFSVLANPSGLIFAGLLVGFGTQLGSGCTSGHGVCGLARGSKRSLVATLVFMGTGALTVYLIRHTALSGLGGGS
jgi:uncharacterized membrane protein YedE/YeeE